MSVFLTGAIATLAGVALSDDEPRSGNYRPSPRPTTGGGPRAAESKASGPVRVPAPGPPARPPLALLSVSRGHRAAWVGGLVHEDWGRSGPTTRSGVARVGAGRGKPKLHSGARIVVRLATKQPPSRVMILFYPRVDHKHLPTGDATTIDCLPHPHRSSCGYPQRRGGQSIPITLSVPSHEVAAIVVNAGWYVPRRLRQATAHPPVEVSAAWLFRVRQA